MKKILVIEPSGNLYGSEMVLLDIITNCNPNKFHFSIVIPSNAPFSTILKSHGFKTYELLNTKKSVYKIISYIRLFCIVSFKNPDLLFVNQAGIQRIISMMANLLRIPVISEVSTLEDGLLVNKFNKKAYKPVKSFICNSEFIADNLKVNNSKKSILYYGYEWKNLNATIHETTNPFRIALLGRISESKGHFLLVESVYQLLKLRPDINLEIYFIGDAPHPSIENQIKEIIKSYNISNRFIFRGFQTDINKELSNMNMMVIPSIQEPFGRIFCETAEAKLPCIVADSGGLGELSKRFDIGIRFKGNHVDDLSKKIEYCYDHFEIIKNEFQEKAHPFLLKFDKREYIKSIEYILDKAIKNEDISIKWLGNNEL